MDVHSRGPLWKLSNFATWPFALDDVRCAGMEAFLQSLKADTEDEQAAVAGMVGFAAKQHGRGLRWSGRPHVMWCGRTINRFGPEYQRLIDRAYLALVRANPGFVSALLATGTAVLTHKIGRANAAETVLTEAEFVSRLHRIRAWLQADSLAA